MAKSKLNINPLDWSDNSVKELVRKKFGIGGSSQAMQDVISRLLLAAPTDLTVLITGETGTGKEVFASAIKGLSPRAEMPFVSVNCGAIPETLLESELFGHEKGAFTGATDRRKGFFETADKGTILLDEIGEMPVGTQVKLLRVLESGEFMRLGSTDTIKVDVRVIAATNRKLEEETEKGNFRRDLFFRLNSVRIELPPLRERTDDIPELAETFAKRTCLKLGIAFEGISPDAIAILQKLPWEGNIRELKNMIETMVTLEKTGSITPEILMSYIPPALPPFREKPQPKEVSLVPVRDFEADRSGKEFEILFRSLLDLKSEIGDIKRSLIGLSLKTDDIKDDLFELHKHVASDSPKEVSVVTEELVSLSEMEHRMISLALSVHNGNRRKAAQSLGISERTLYRKLIEHDLE